MSFASAHTLLTITLILALGVLLWMYFRQRQESRKQSVSPQGGARTLSSGAEDLSSNLRSENYDESALLRHEKLPELLQDLAGRFEREFSLDFAEFTLQGRDGPSTIVRANQREKRIKLGKNLEASFRWVANPQSKLNEENLAQLSSRATAYVENLDRLDRYKQLALRDPLTGLYNAAYFHTRLTEELKRTERFDRKVGLLVVDIDNFKAINDGSSHLEGDRTLCRIADLLRDSVRATDVVSRYGGDEFCLILTDSDETSAESFMLRLHARISEEEIGQSPRPLTVSIGGAVGPWPGSTAESLFVAADQAMLSAKRQGRNRCAMAEITSRASG